MKIQLSEHFTYKKLFKFVLPSIIMMIFTSIYGMIDGLFVSNFVNDKAFAAINFIYPLIMILGGMGFMIGTGGSALVSKVLGEKDDVKARRYFTMMIIFTIILGLVLTIVGLLLIRPFALISGVDQEVYAYSVSYSTIVISFTTFFMLQNVFQSFLITSENPKLGLFVTILAGMTNIILDALFIAVLKLGVVGAAIATGIGQFIGGSIPLIYFCKKSSLLHFTKTKLELKPILNACWNGSSELMSNISSSVVSMLYNFQLLKLIGDHGVSSYGVLMYLQFVFLAISIGYSIGTAPIISYNYGAQNNFELKNIFKKSMIFIFSSGICLTILAQLLAVPLANLFVGYNKELFLLTIHALRLFSFSFLLSGFNVFSSSFFTALNNGTISAIISFLRTLVFQVLSIFILPIFFKTDGIWLSIVVAELCAFIISFIFMVSKKKKYNY